MPPRRRGCSPGRADPIFSRRVGSYRMRYRAGVHMRAQRGEGKVGFLIALAMVGVAVFLGLKIIPVRVAAYEFHDTLREECRMAAVHEHDADVAKRIMEKAQALEIPLERKNLTL